MEPECYPGGHSITTKKELIDHLKKYGMIQSMEVAKVMETIDRALFVREGSLPYIDSPQEIGYDSAISAPRQHAICLDLLKDHLKPGMSALDIGSGSGYMTACFALMVGSEGRAVGIEKVSELILFSVKNIEKVFATRLLEQRSITFQFGDGTKGLAQFAPYDAIHFGGLAAEIYPALTNQLKRGGRLVIPVGGDGESSGLRVVDKKDDGTLNEWKSYDVRPGAVMDRGKLINRQK